MKSYIILLLSFFVLSCKNDPELNAKKIRLTKVEMITEGNGNRTSVLTEEYKYDSQSYLIEVRFLNSNNNTLTYKIEYDVDKHISKITSTDISKTQRIIILTWTNNSVTANASLSDGRQINYSFDLNENKLPYRKHYANKTETLSWDTNGNVVKVVDEMGNTSWQAIEYDLTKLYPYSTSYELQIFNTLLRYDSFVFRPRNWLLKQSVTLYPDVIRNDDVAETVSETNRENYPTVTTYSGTSYKSIYTYNQ